METNPQNRMYINKFPRIIRYITVKLDKNGTYEHRGEIDVLQRKPPMFCDGTTSRTVPHFTAHSYRHISVRIPSRGYAPITFLLRFHRLPSVRMPHFFPILYVWDHELHIHPYITLDKSNL